MKPILMDRRNALRLAAGGALALAGCREPANSILVGSKNFTEQIVLGELLAQQIEAHTSLRAPTGVSILAALYCVIRRCLPVNWISIPSTPARR